MSSEPIFIAGPDRSGTTLMYALLASHPNLSMVRRTNMWRYFHGQYGDLAEKHNLDRCLDHMVRYNRMRHLKPDRERIREEFWQGEPTYGRLFALFHEHNAERMGKSRWGDKSLHTEHFADQLFAEFPQAKVIHMSRDPRDRYASVSKRYGRNLQRVGAATGRWLISMKAAERNLKKYPNNYKIVHFEKLAANPREVAQEICTFIGEPFAPEMLAMEGAREHKQQGGNSSFGPLKPGAISTKPIGRFRTVLGSAEIAFIQKVAAREMQSLDYQREPQKMMLGPRLHYYLWLLPANLLRMLGWVTLFKIRVSRGIKIPATRLTNPATVPQIV